MNITRDVITDLLPAYFSGDASPDTTALIEEFLRQDPDFIRAVERQRREFAAQGDLLAPAAALAPDHELRTLLRTRSAIQRQKWLLGFALMLTAFPFSFVVNGSGLLFMVVRDEPWLAAAAWAGAGLLWILYFRLRRNLKVSGLAGRNRKAERP